MIPAFPLALRPWLGVVVGVAAALLLDHSQALLAVLCWTLLARVTEPLFSDRRGWLIQALAVLAEWQLLEVVGSNVAGLIVPVISQAAVVALAWISRPAAEPPPQMAKLTSIGAGLAILLGISATSLAGPTATWLHPALIVSVSYLAVRLARTWAYRTAGGVSQNALAYTRIAVEVTVLLVLVSGPLPEVYQRFGAR